MNPRSAPLGDARDGAAALDPAREAAADQERLRRCLERVAPYLSDDSAGFYGPGSVTWLLYREPVVLLSGLAAVLLQVAHPAVAAGVAQRSGYRADLVGRTLRTGAALNQLAFGRAEDALQLSLRLHRMHARVRGTVIASESHSGSAVDARESRAQPYRANAPELMAWVWATLIDTPQRLWEAVYRPLTPAERAQAYQEALRTAVLLGIPAETLPQSPEAFASDYASRLTGLRVGPEARDIAAVLLSSNLCRLVPGARTLTIGLLPPALRDQYGLRFDDAAARRYQHLLSALRLLVRVVPGPLRRVPAYHRARLRVTLARLGLLREASGQPHAPLA